ncbi:CusA/CzcA family heavy metal efflux RND transporter [Parapedobacter koreensis]|uniref:Cobalt-zinc-cadmium resistance protein CzcA n=1 Tax=Parapedobacter koreensis TaxID=332977 RepID=A0A1H7MZG7_9SPHI|nr:CusA/CzcA family heavy metal efflux RND transporter [Parapedobacter koreensis]SEL16471.1 cobalt-zinc-cadmium resistance protein CzcA [Parapedobacter koreensis]
MLDSIINFSIKNKIIIGLMTFTLIVWGVWSASKLPIDAVPDITNNQVQIITICPTLAGQEVEQLVTFPIEQSIANVPDIDEIRSISRFGLSVITAVFQEDVDVYFARQLIHERLQEAAEQIPAGIGTPELAPVSTGLGEVYQYILHPKAGSEANYSAMDLRTMQDWIVARQLRGTPGVAEINSFGGQLKQYEVSVNPDRLKSLDVGIPEIFDALEANNQNTGGAYIDKKPNAYFIRGIGLVNSLEDVGNIVVKSRPNSVPIFIKDVAEVRFGGAIRYGALTYNGEVDAVGGVVMMLKGHNSNEVVQRIKDKIPTIQQSLPDDVVIEPYLDRTELVGRAMSTVERNLIEGALIVIFVLVVFLGNLRAGLIVASSIPLAMLFALGMMNVFGVSANLMSLGAIDFGLIVDGAVIVVEATLHHLGLRQSTGRLTQREMDEEVYHSASKIRTSAAFGEIIILIVYIPILTLVGIEGKMFRPMAMTVGFAILGALILSLTYIPMMCALFLPKTKAAKASFSDRMMARLQRIYRPLLEGALRIKYVLIGTTVAVFALSLIIFSRMGGEFIPQLEEGDFAFHCILPQGTSLSQSIETSMQASRIIKQFDEVKMVVGKTGAAEVPTDPMPPEATDMMIILKPRDEWAETKTYKQLADEIMEKLAVMPGVFFESNQPIQMRFNELMTGIRQDVAVKIFGENLDSLLGYANQVSEIIQGVDGITAPQVERIAGLPQINVEYDRARIANYGLSVSALNDILSTAFAGKAAGLVFENERRFELVVRLDSAHRSSIEDVGNLWVPLPTGEQVPLSQLAQVSFKMGPAQISREDGKRRIVIGFNLDGRDVASAVAEIQTKLQQQVKLPAGYYYTYGGMFENLQEASKRLLIAVPVSLALIFMLLFFTFHTFKHATLIFTAIPMSAIGGVFALLLRGMPFSISAGIGFIALFGVAVLNGIVLIGTFNQLEKDGWTDVVARVMEGTKIRLRPVLMTAAVASLGFLPMALSNTAGAEVQRPLATVVIGGLVTATFLTLFILPLLYVVFNGKARPRSHAAGIVTGAPLLIFIALLTGIPQVSQAQVADSTDGITIEQAISIALTNNKDVLADELYAKASASKLAAAMELPKTEVSGQFGSFNSLERDNAFQLSQTIPFPTVFGARRKLYHAEAEASQIKREITVNALKSQVQTSFYQIQYLLHRQGKLAYLDSLYADATRAASLRHQTGEGSLLEVNTAITKRGEIKLLWEENEGQLQNAYNDFKALLNTDSALAVAHGVTYEPLKLTDLVDSAAIKKHPLIRGLQQDALIAEQNRKVEVAQALPDLTVGYTNQSLVGTYLIDGREQFVGRDRRFSFMNAGIAIPLTFGATKGRIRALEYQRQAAEATAQQATRAMGAQLLNAQEQYELRVRRHEYFVQQALPNAEHIIQAAQLGYRTGEISYVEYLYALQTSTDVELAYLAAVQALNQSVITIHFLINN